MTPLIKSQQKPASFQRVFRDILAVYRIEVPALGRGCRKGPTPSPTSEIARLNPQEQEA